MRQHDHSSEDNAASQILPPTSPSACHGELPCLLLSEKMGKPSHMIVPMYTDSDSEDSHSSEDPEKSEGPNYYGQHVVQLVEMMPKAANCGRSPPWSKVLQEPKPENLSQHGSFPVSDATVAHTSLAANDRGGPDVILSDVEPKVLQSSHNHQCQDDVVSNQCSGSEDGTASQQLEFKEEIATVPKAKKRQSSIYSAFNSIRLHAEFFGIPLFHIAKPIFVILQLLTAVGFYVVNRYLHGESRAGLDSIWPSQTDLRIGFDCHDHRLEIWRWFTYQFTHISVAHVTMNSMLLLLAVPFERFHGSLRTFVFFNIGVLGGACCWFVSDGHTIVIGMSGGCYAIFGLYLADLLINWHDKVCRVFELLALTVAAAGAVFEAVVIETGSASHSAHVGGCVAGLLIGAAFGRNVKETCCTAYLRALSIIVGMALFSFAACWAQLWPPRNIWTLEPWCWVRQVNNEHLFGDAEWHCVRCDSQACMDRWSLEKGLASAHEGLCFAKLGGWSVTER